MPHLFIDTAAFPDLYNAGAVETINGRSCTRHTKSATSPSDVSDLWVDASGMVCQFRFDDFRTVTVSNVQTNTAIDSSTFTPPDGCKCGKPVDIVMVLDRSGSISPTEFLDQKGFVDGFSQNFNYGPYEAALGIVHFNKKTWTSLTLREGTNPTNVLNGVNALACCNTDPNANSCCCCGTSISSGIRLGAEQMATGRPDAAHILAVISDGYHNHNILKENCAGEESCRIDLQDSVKYAKQLVPDIIIYAVGVGADRDVSADELLIISDNHPERIMRREDFSALANDNLELVARACQENINPCGGCCGFCVCGQCQAPDGCDAANFCTEAAVSGVCCKKAPRTCPEDPNDKCKVPICDTEAQACSSQPVPCRDSDSCFQYSCDPTTGRCVETLMCGDVPACVEDVDCNDNNDCTTDRCVNTVCVWEDVVCPAATMCESIECLPSGGCTVTPFEEDYCDDQNVCTTDVCDPTLGCQHTPITCVTDSDPCTLDECDPFLGCRYPPMICDPPTNEESCDLTYCDEGACAVREVACATDNVAVAAGIGAAAIVGIIVGIVICLAALGGGGAYAYSQAGAVSNVATVANNPIYVGSGSQGTNPLYQVH